MGLPLLAVSGEEVAVALQRAGFQAGARSGSAVALHRGYRSVLVPTGPIPSEALRELLRAAGLSYSVFLDLLEGREPLRDSQVRAAFDPDRAG